MNLFNLTLFQVERMSTHNTSAQVPNIPSLPGITYLHTPTTTVPKITSSSISTIPSIIPTVPSITPTPLVIPTAPKIIPTPLVIPTAPKIIPTPLVIPTAPKIISTPLVIPTASKIISTPLVASNSKGKNSILSKIENLAYGKVLNVSKLQSNGTGARVMQQTKGGKYKGTPNLPIVSDNLESYILAINMIPNGFELYSKDIDEMTRIFTTNNNNIIHRGNNNNIIHHDNNNNEVFEDNYPTIDLFDFDTYAEDYILFSQYFVDLELVLRTAIWISYKYGRLDPEERRELMQEYNTKFAKGQWLENLTDVFEHQQLLYSWMKHFNPRLLENFTKISTNYQHYPGLYFNRAYRRYVDPEWIDAPLWFQ
jgi:hypothetical protein